MLLAALKNVTSHGRLQAMFKLRSNATSSTQTTANHNNAHLGPSELEKCCNCAVDSAEWAPEPERFKQDFSLASRRVKRKSKMFAEKKENTTRRKTGGS